LTLSVLKTIAAFLNTEGGDLLIGVADDKSVIGLEPDRFENEDKFMLHLAQMARNTLGDRASTCIDPRIHEIQGRKICLVGCRRSPEPVFLKWKEIEESESGDFYVRSGPGSIKLSAESAAEYIRTRFSGIHKGDDSAKK
jgi:predicted HTH transcriptional regulator